MRSLRRRYGRFSKRRYHVIVVNDRNGKVTRMTSSPVTHEEGVIIMSKIDVRRGWLRKMLEEVR